MWPGVSLCQAQCGIRGFLGAVGCTSAQSFFDQAPLTKTSLQAAEEGLRAQGSLVGTGVRWEQRFSTAANKRQKEWSREVHRTAYRNLLGSLTELDQAEMRSAGGIGAGSFLLPPSLPEHWMPDAHFKVATRARLRADQLPAGHGRTCQHRSAQTRQLCNEPLDQRCRHARVCKTGGGVVRRHDSIRDWLAKWIRDVTGRATLTEQFVPRWDRQNDQGQLVRARLDVAFADAQGRRVYLDVAVSDPATPNVHELRQRANRNGAAAMREEDAKRLRYPGPDLTPFVLESLGRMGPSADAFLRAVVPKDMENRALVLGQARQSLSVLLQTGTAELVLSASP